MQIPFEARAQPVQPRLGAGLSHVRRRRSRRAEDRRGEEGAAEQHGGGNKKGTGGLGLYSVGVFEGKKKAVSGHVTPVVDLLLVRPIQFSF